MVPKNKKHKSFNKVFGIGLPKTGQTSLTKALGILGFKSIQYPRNLSLIKKYDAATDLIVALNFKKLNRLYPNSKFICTVRDSQSWLISMANHFQKFPYEKMPQNSRISLRLAIRKAFWGRLDFDRKTMKERRMKHYLEVRKFFKDRPKDILFINITNGDSWPKLCQFLKVNIPKVKFPKERVGDYS